MISTIEKSWLRFALFAAALGTTLIITPSFSAEPVDLPKLFTLAPMAFFAFGFMANNAKILLRKDLRIVTSLAGLFIAQITLVLFFAKSPFNQQFFGASGRNTGYLAYLCLCFILIASLLVSDLKFFRLLSFGLMSTGLASTLYGGMQYLKMDPIKWNNPYNPIIGFLGNPNFASSFIAFSSSFALVLLVARKTKFRNRILVFVITFISFGVVALTHSQQGVLVFGIEVILVVGVHLYKNTRISHNLKMGFSAIAIAISVVTVMGIFKIGPLANSLYKLSVRQRGFYWHAGIEMMKNHPLTGVGMDSYGDWYFKFRSANAAFHSMLTQSNSAHNVFLDIGSNGGIPLFVLYVSLVGYTAFRGILTLKNASAVEPYFLAVFAAWIGYQAQSVISINNLGLAVWGWLLSGAVIGYSFEISRQGTTGSKSIRRRKVSNLGASTLAIPTLALCLGLAAVMPALLADRNYRLAQQSRSASALIDATAKYPESTGRTTDAAQLLLSSNLVPQGLQLAKHVVEINPNSYNAWLLIYKTTQPKSQDNLKALAELRRLNPQDPSYK
jgi:O-antigen ligase